MGEAPDISTALTKHQHGNGPDSQPSAASSAASDDAPEEACRPLPAPQRQSALKPPVSFHDDAISNTSTAVPSPDSSGHAYKHQQESITFAKDVVVITSEKHAAAAPTADIDIELGDGPRPRKRKQHIKPRVPLHRRLFTISPTSPLRALFTPTHPIGPPPGYLLSVKNALLYSPLNLLLVFIPVSWATHYAHQPDGVVFASSALAILPLAALLGLGTEQVAIRTSSAVGGLLNATLGNIVELIIAGIALVQCELSLVQSSLLGGLISNMLLVLGMAFVVGGYRFPEQTFRPMAAQLNSSLMTLGVISLLVPTAFHHFVGVALPQEQEGPILLQLSRVFAVVLIFIYLFYLFFQFYSHHHLFQDLEQESFTSSSSSSSSSSSTRSSRRSSMSSGNPDAANASRSSLSATIGASTAIPFTLTVSEHDVTQDVEQQEQHHVHQSGHPLTSVDTYTTRGTMSSTPSIKYPRLNTPTAFALLVLTTALTFITAENLVSSLSGLTAADGGGTKLSKEFLCVIIIPILSNAAEHATAVLVAYKGKFDLALGVAIGSCVQISLFVIPFLILIAWGLGKPLGLLFDPLETICLFLSVVLVKFCVEDGKTHWMSGMVLLGVYIIFSATFWFYPTALVGTLSGNDGLFACVTS